VLARERDLGRHEDPGPRPLPAPDRVLRWARPVLLPLSSAMRVCTEERVVGLTYDDGPHPVHTTEILAALAARGVRATFFVLAEAAERNPELVAGMLAAGHEIGLHGIDHARLTDEGWVEAVRAVRTGRHRLEAVTGRPVRMYRPTYGALGLAQFTAARRLGMEVVFWTAWAQDWVDDTVEAVAARAVGARHPGAILLLHDTTEDTADDDLPLPTFSRGAVTAAILDGLAEDGYRAVPAGELLAGYPVVRAVTTQRPWVTARRRVARVRRHAAPP
jgi:peptidoglycan/xylan/chitin deacetylase (PgdA/CDA1 family)